MADGSIGKVEASERGMTPTPNAPSPAGAPTRSDEHQREGSARVVEKPAIERRPDEPTDERTKPVSGSRRGRARIWIAIAIVAAILIVFLMTRSSKKKAAAASAARAQAANRSVPVLAVPTTKGDIGAYLTGLGTVTAVNTVTVRS